MSKPADPADDRALNVTLAGRPYPLRVSRSDEEAIRRIGKELNDKVVEFQKTYVGRDKQDCLAMLLLLYAVDLYKLKDGQTAPAAGALPEDALATVEQLKADIRAALAESAVEDEGGADDADA